MSNRRRLVEAVARVVPWIGAGAVGALLGFARGGIVVGIAVAVTAAAAIAFRMARVLRRAWRDPAATAHALDREHRTADLLQTALAIEARGADPAEPLEPVVVERATALVPDLERTAVPRLRLRTSAAGGLTAIAATALLLLTGSGAAPDDAAKDAVGVLGTRERAAARSIGEAIDALAHDPTLPDAVRDKVARAKQALAKAGEATNGRAAMAALSEASRLLDEAAKQMAAQRTLSQEALDKMTSSQLAEQLAKAAKAGDSQKLASVAREALKRASMTPGESAALAAAIKQAIANAKRTASDPWSQADGSPSAQRLDKLGAAADQLASNDLAAAKAELGDLARSTAGAGQPRDARAGKLDAARQAMAALRDAQRGAMNGGNPTSADARADAARRAASGKQPGAGQGKQPGNGPPGGGQPGGNGTGNQQGAAGNGPPGAPGSPGHPDHPLAGTAPGETPPGGALSVLQAPSGMSPPGGAAGTSGNHGGTTPSGATEPETVAAEEVDTQQPPPSPDGVIRAIAERSAGDHRSEKFGSIVDHYAAVAEAAIHRDQIPLTRRDFIQRYFQALRTREEP